MWPFLNYVIPPQLYIQIVISQKIATRDRIEVNIAKDTVPRQKYSKGKIIQFCVDYDRAWVR